MIEMETARRIKEARAKAGMSLQEVADRVGVKNSTISRYENGQIKKMKLPVVQAIAEALHVSPMWLIGYDEDPVDYEDGELIASIPLGYLELCEGDVRRAYAMMEAADRDVIEENKKTPDTLIDIESLSEDKRALVDYVMSLSDAEARVLRGMFAAKPQSEK